jgi:hypothetical protein
VRYFRDDLGRASVTVGEPRPSGVLRGFGFEVITGPEAMSDRQTIEYDLRQFAVESGAGFELAFFPRLRDLICQQRARSPHVLRFTGLRGCVKQLMAARRWSPRCRLMSDHIIGFLRRCLEESAPASGCSMVVL